MPDFPIVEAADCPVSFCTMGFETIWGQWELPFGGTQLSASWGTANLAIYQPITIARPFLAQKMAVDVGTQSGNLDVGIYTEKGTRLVSAGSTAVAVAGLQVIDITDTWLAPGTFFVAMNCDTVSAAFFGRTLSTATLIVGGRVSGIVSQAVGALALPSTATFAAISATRMVPTVTVAGVATI